MPKVPTYENSPVQIQNAAPHLTASPNAFQGDAIAAKQMGDLGGAMQSFGGEMTREATAAQILTNEAKLKDADSGLMGAIQSIQHGSKDDPSTGYFNKSGGDAVSGRDLVAQKITDLKRQYMDGLDNDAQRRMFGSLADSRINSAQAQVNDHYSQQLKVYSVASSETRIAVAGDSAASVPNPISAGAQDDFIGTVKSEAGHIADINGITDPVLRAEYVRGKVENVYVGTIGHLLDNKDTTTANVYFEGVKDQLDTKTRDKLQVEIRKGDVLGTSQKLSDDIVERNAGDESKALVEVRNIEDAEIRKNTQALVEERFNTDKRIKDNQTKAANDAGLLHVTSGGGLRELLNSPEWKNMSPEGQHLARTWAQQSQEHALKMSTEDRMQSLSGLQQVYKIRQDNPAMFSNMNIVETAKNLGIANPLDVKQLILLQASVNQGDAKEQSQNTANKNARAIYDPILATLKISPLPGMSTSKKSEAEQNVAQFKSKIQEDIQLFMEHNGGKIPDTSALKGLVNQNLQKVFIHDKVVPVFGSDSEAMMFNVPADKLPNAYAISAEALKKQNKTQYDSVFSSLTWELGRKPTDTEIENKYSSLVFKQRGAGK
jgi:hypothetical protein